MPIGILGLGKYKKSKQNQKNAANQNSKNEQNPEPAKAAMKAPLIVMENEDLDSMNEDNEDYDEQFIEIPSTHQRLRGRESVSAEAYGTWNTPKKFTPPVFAKYPEQEKGIQKAICESFLFMSLDDDQIKTVINAFQEVKANPEQIIIQEGDDGDKLYLIEEGKVNVYKQNQKSGDVQILCELTSGDIFGELALMYNAPRAATVKALTEVKMWALDRETFNNIVRDATIKKREMYEQLLKEVELLKDMEDYERSKVADALKENNFETDEFIIKEGDIGDIFYILIEGTAVAIKEGQVVMNYEKGGYFGELSLVKNQPRAASIKATTRCRVVSLNRKSFKRLLGPLENILIRNVEKYKKIISELGLNVDYLNQS